MPGKAGRGWRSAGTLIAAAAVALAGAAAVSQWLAAGRAEDALAGLESERTARLEVSAAAHAFGQALLSYDYENLPAGRTRITALATADFVGAYDEAFGGRMEQVIAKLKARSQAGVRDVYVAAVERAEARAVVVVDQQVTTAETITSVKDSHLKIALVKEKDTWKVREVTVLGAAQENRHPVGGARRPS
ncbi:hypothetical protein [Nonomuraea longicatena]|uniref:Mce-associated membrane protein n=1 Tax=Nonomuraea longicatena TaxID=83682 RepID=A0ABP3ZM06_9ACTN